MEDLIDSGVRNEVSRPHGKLVVKTKPVFKRKIGKDGEIDK